MVSPPHCVVQVVVQVELTFMTLHNTRFVFEDRHFLPNVLSTFLVVRLRHTIASPGALKSWCPGRGTFLDFIGS